MKQIQYILTVFFLALFALPSSKAQDCDMLTNSDFQLGLRSWEKINQQGGWARFSTSGDAVNIDIANKAFKVWGIQLIQAGLLFENGKSYRVAFEAKADSNKHIVVGTSQNGGSYTNYSSQKFEILPEWTSYTYDFTNNAPTDKRGRIEFNVGLDTFDISLRNIHVQALNCLDGSEPLLIDEEVLAEREAAFEELQASGGAPSIPRTINKEGFMKLNVQGYVRLGAFYRSMTDWYPYEGFAPKALVINGVENDVPLSDGNPTGYREPLLQLDLSGKPTPNTEVGVDLLFDNQMIGQLTSPDARRVQIFRWINLKGSAISDYGKFNVSFGGINFINMSPLTLWRYEIRDDMFYRTPWEWSHNSFDRYTEFYKNNSIAKDPRFGNVAFQGIIFNAEGLPGRMGLDFAFGKSDGSNNGFQSFLANNFKYIVAGRLYKKIGKHTLSFNAYNQIGYQDNIKAKGDATNEEQEMVYTIDGNLKAKFVNTTFEIGTSTFKHPFHTEYDWDPVINLKSAFNAIGRTGIKPSIHLFYIGENFVNPNSIANNTTQYGGSLKISEGPTVPYYLNTSFYGGLNEIGQVSNNRKGLSLILAKNFKNLKTSLGFNASQDVNYDADNLLHRYITFQHYNMGFNRSKFAYYKAQEGPYQRNVNTWRRSFETVYIADTSFGGLKNYNTVDLSTRYKTRIGGKGLIFSNYMNYNSVAENFSPIPKFSDKAFIRTFYNEFMTFFQLKPKTTLVLLYGFERVKGNTQINTTDEAGTKYETETPYTLGHSGEDSLVVNYITTPYRPSGLPISQIGHSFGVGLDLDFTDRSGLYLRQKWFSHNDENFTLDKFKGWEFTAEFKLRF